ncbi:MAG: glycosyltransferase family 2 protein [Lapillicoccus sp.]
MFDISVVVVTYDSADVVDAFLASVHAASAEPVALTVVDNGSVDGTLERLDAHAGCEVIRAPSNGGYGTGANLGVRASATAWVVVANPDIVFHPGCLDELLAVSRRWPRAGALGPRILTADGRLYPSARELPSLGRGIGHATFGWFWPTNPWTQSYRRERGKPVEDRVGWLSGACLMVRREGFDAVGGFDESYFMYFEDVDLCERLAQVGWDIVYAPSASIEHVGGHSASRNLVGMSRTHHDSAYLYLSRRYAGARWLPVRGALRAGLWARFSLSKVLERVAHGAEPTRPA